MRRYHVVLASPIGIEATRRDVQAGLRPRHFMLELAARLDATIHEPSETTAPPDLLHKILKTPGPVIDLARRVAAACQDEDVIFCNSESVALPVAQALIKARKGARLASFGHNLYRPRIALAKLLSGAFRRIDRFHVISKDQLRDPDRQRLYLEQVDDRFFTPRGKAEPAPGPNARPLIVSVGLEQRDYVTLAKATSDMDLDVRISGASRDARVLRETFPEVMPANMDKQFYSWPDLRDLYRRADLVVVPVRPNSYAAGITSILEALAVGKPVIASRTTGLDGTLADDAAVEWVPPSDAGALRSAIARLLQDAPARDALAENGAAIFAGHHRKDLRVSYMADDLKGL
ncbi:MAG: glycosyltransferase family 4 protein [Pseudomonadota bacterium]